MDWMRRWMTVGVAAVIGSMLVSMLGAGPDRAVALEAGGLTALPEPPGFGGNLLVNPGFETPSPTNATKPANWSTTPALSLDATVRRSGTYSYKLTAALNTSYRNHMTQQVSVEPGTYRASGWIRTSAFGDGTVTGARLGFAGKHAPVVGGTREWTYVEVDSIVVATAGTYVFIIDQYGTPAPSGEAWYDDLRLEKHTAAPLDVFMRYPNYRGMLFDDQPMQIALDVTVQPPSGTLADHVLLLELVEEGTGAELAARSYASPPASLIATLDASGMLADLPYRLRVTLRAAGGALVYAFPELRVVRVPAARRATMNIAFDDRNRIRLRDVPRFVLGVYDAGGGYSTLDSYWENQIWSLDGHRRLEGLRINFYLNYHLGAMPATSTAALLANLQRRGVMYLQTYNCFEDGPASRMAFSSADDAYVLDYGERAGSAGYYTIDECTPARIPEAFDNLQRLKRLDPDSMTFAALLPRDDVVLFREAADVLSTDPYPLYGAEPAGGYPHGNVARDTIRTRNAVKNARPFFTVLQFFKFTSNSRWPTFEEMRAHAYMSIVEGAKGLFWWSVGVNALQNEPEPSRTEQLNKLKALVRELADLEPVLLADATPAALGGVSTPDVRTLVKTVGGTGYVFAYNNSATTLTATFTWGAPVGTVRVNAEDRTLAVSGTSFTDTFGPWQAHVYVVEPSTAPANTAPVAEATSAVTRSDTAVVMSLTARDAEQCELGFSIVTPPAHGQLGSVLASACSPGAPNVDRASVVYTPAPGFAGADGFTYRASDGALTGASATATITVDGPPRAADPSVSTAAETPITIALTATDAEDCELAFEIAIPPGQGLLGPVTAAACTAGTPNSDRATVVYTPAGGYSGSDTFAFRVSDRRGGSSTGTVSISVLAPEAAPAPPPAPPSDSTAMYVANLAFESRQRGARHDERIVVLVRRDSNASGAADPQDAVVPNATVTVDVSGPGGLTARFTGTTGKDGVFRTGWLNSVPVGSYAARVTGLTHTTDTWNRTLDPTATYGGTDPNGFPQATHSYPH